MDINIPKHDDNKLNYRPNSHALEILGSDLCSSEITQLSGKTPNPIWIQEHKRCFQNLRSLTYLLH